MELLNLNDFNKNYLELHKDTLEAIKELESLTKKEVIFRIVNQSEAVGYFTLKTKLARSFMGNHIIIINEDRIEDKNDLNYWIVHEIMHGLRVFNAKPEERKILASNNASLSKIVEDIIETMDKDLISNMDISSLNQYCNNLLFNLNMMLFNSSVDARIELGIYNKYPELRNLQKKVQKNYLKELLSGFVDNNIIRYTPSWVVYRVNLMNYCYMKKITPIIGKAWTSKANGVIDEDFENIVNKMMYYLDKDDLGQISDNETIVEWSKILGMDGYTKLIDFENVPYNYEYSN